MNISSALRPPAEVTYYEELRLLGETDTHARPPGWRLSPLAVKAFIIGDEQRSIPRKFYGDDTLVERIIVGLASNRGLLLVGEPGTAKSMLSELLTAAISGDSTNTIQGSAGVTEDQVKYSWNYALLLAEGPTLRALVPSAVYTGMRAAKLVRFEELTRCPPEIQDALISILSEKMLIISELSGGERVILAQPGFNIVATANTRDRGVHEMSSALKRRFNFETVQPIRDLALEVTLVQRECARLLQDACAPVEIDRQVIELLVTAFHDLREGVTAEGIQVEKASAVMSTAEAVSVAMSAGIDAHYFGKKILTPECVCRHLSSAVTKDTPEDSKKLKHYFDVVVGQRGRQRGGLWSDFAKARKWLV